MRTPLLIVLAICAELGATSPLPRPTPALTNTVDRIAEQGGGHLHPRSDPKDWVALGDGSIQDMGHPGEAEVVVERLLPDLLIGR